jgi:hypothetical protein
MTETNPKLTSTELPENPGANVDHGAGFVLPWRMDPNQDHPSWQQDVHSCSCGCGCAKGRKLAARMAKDAKELAKVLQGVEAFVANLKKEGKKPAAAKSKKRRKK